MTSGWDIKGYRNMLWRRCCMMSEHLILWHICKLRYHPLIYVFFLFVDMFSFYLWIVCSANFLQSKTTLAKGEAVSMGSSAHQLMFAHKSEA